MKTILISVLISFTSLLAHANPECFDFDVQKNSTELVNVRFSIMTEKKKTVATVTGVTADKRITNEFECKGSAKLSCEHALGAGDFELEVGNEATLKFSYVNLAIGGTGPNAPKEDDEINEDFAFLDKSSAGNDDEEESGHLGDVILKGKKVSCDSKLK